LHGKRNHHHDGFQHCDRVVLRDGTATKGSLEHPGGGLGPRSSEMQIGGSATYAKSPPKAVSIAAVGASTDSGERTVGAEPPDDPDRVNPIVTRRFRNGLTAEASADRGASSRSASTQKSRL
jgi:hypothetical protein